MSNNEKEPLSFTEKQGQYLAFIYAFTKIFGWPPSEAEIQKKFQVSAPTVHQMILGLEKRKLIRRMPKVARSIELLLPPEQLPILI